MHHNYKYALATGATLALFSFTKPASADVVVDWNLITVKATKVAKYNSNLGSRIEAIEAIAVYDAVNSIKKIGTPYHYYAPPFFKSTTYVDEIDGRLPANQLPFRQRPENDLASTL